MHGFAASRGHPLSYRKGTRSAGQRPEFFDKYRFDEARSLRAVVFRQRPVGSPVEA
jgi:hypothetical protein